MEDALSDVLQLLKLRGVVYFMKDFSAPWGMNIDEGNHAQLHIIVRGNCWLKSETEQKPQVLTGGDIVLFPKGHAHWLADSAGSNKMPGKKVVESIQNEHNPFADGEYKTTIICGHFEFDRQFKHPLMESLPVMIHIKSSALQPAGWFETILRSLVSEAESKDAGSEIVVQKMAEVLFIQIFRAYIRQSDVPTNFISAFTDSRISKALQLIHRSPENKWTLDSLARSIGMSRSAFAVQFKKLVQDTPNHYIFQWRMNTARKLLMNRQYSLLEIAEQVGYVSEASFSRAFKKLFNQNPGALRREMQPNRLGGRLSATD